MKPFILGIDVGGSKTVAWLAQAGPTDRARIAALAELVLTLAATGDSVLAALVTMAARNLAAMPCANKCSTMGPDGRIRPGAGRKASAAISSLFVRYPG